MPEYQGKLERYLAKHFWLITQQWRYLLAQAASAAGMSISLVNSCADGNLYTVDDFRVLPSACLKNAASYW
jgi:hypothetical protein